MKQNLWIWLSLCLILGSYAIIQLVWIATSMPDYNAEDDIILGKSVVFYLSQQQGTLTLKEIYHSVAQPLIPFMLMLSYILWRDVASPLLLNTLFGVILGITTFIITRKLYGLKAAFIATCLVLCNPGLLAISRTMYAEYILTSILMLTVLSYIYSDGLKNIRATMVFVIFSILALLTKYSAISYIGSIFVFHFISAAYDSRKNLRNLLKNRGIWTGIISASFIILAVFSHYQHELNLPNYFSSAEDKQLANLRSMGESKLFFCNLINYPIMFMNLHLGLFNILLFSIAILIAFFHKHIRGEYLLSFIFVVNSIFFSFMVVTKNQQVLVMVIPMMIILASGMISKLIKPAFIALSVLIALYCSAILLSPDLGFLQSAKTRIPIGCSSPSASFEWEMDAGIINNRDIFFGKSGLLEFSQKAQSKAPIITEIRKAGGAGTTELLDLSTDNNFELKFYSVMLSGQDIIIDSCEQAGSAIDSFDVGAYGYVLISPRKYSKDICWNCYIADNADFCNSLRDLALSISSDPKVYPVQDRAYHNISLLRIRP